MCLKYFRERNYVDAFNALRTQAGNLVIEDEILSRLFRCVVTEGDFVNAEQLLLESKQRGFFEDFVANSQYQPVWRRILPTGPGLFKIPLSALLRHR